MPTLKDVARKSGLAVSTVSAICRGKGDIYNISRITQKRVLQLAEEIGYRPNRLAISLKTGVSNFVPVFGRTYRMPITQERQNHIAQMLIEKGFQVLLYDFHWFDEKEAELLASIKEIPVAGLIISDLDQDYLRKELEFFNKHVPCVLVDSGLSDGFDHVYLDRSEVAYLLARYLLQMGYHKIIYTVPEQKKFWLLSERVKGFARAMAEFGKTVSHENFVWLDQKPSSSHQLGLELGRKIIEEKRNPDAVMALNDQVAIGIIRAFSENGIRVPDDIAVVGSENLPEGEFYYVPLTTIDFQIEKVAREVVDLFRRRLTGDWSDFPRKIVVSPKIVIRHSCGFSNKKQKEVCDEKEIMQ